MTTADEYRQYAAECLQATQLALREEGASNNTALDVARLRSFSRYNPRSG
jgi:hypothetical protein